MTTSTPTVVLVHGAFADAASWIGVIAELHSHGIPVIAPPNPLRGLAADAAYVASVASQIDGPVVLVGHSYGGRHRVGEHGGLSFQREPGFRCPPPRLRRRIPRSS